MLSCITFHAQHHVTCTDMPCALFGRGTRIFAHENVLCATTGKLIAPPLPADGYIFTLMSYADLRLAWYNWTSNLKPCFLCRTGLKTNKQSWKTLHCNRIISIVEMSVRQDQGSSSGLDFSYQITLCFPPPPEWLIHFWVFLHEAYYGKVLSVNVFHLVSFRLKC